MLYHPDRRFEQMHRLALAAEEARKARKVARRGTVRRAVGERLVAWGTRLGAEPARELSNC